MNSRIRIASLFLAAMVGLAGCKTIPEQVTAVHPFDKQRYLGQWYEIARFDFSFEKNLDNTTANYTLNADGSIKVTNRGYDTVKKEWKEVIGKAKFVGADSIAMLKVSFFGPFYGGYNVLAIDPDYKYSLVCGGSSDYMWILSREKTIPEDIKARYVALAKDSGFEVDKLLWVNHDK